MSEQCPICKEPAQREANEAYPFCSSRCRLLDLANWLDGDYRIPGPPTFDLPEDDGSSGAEG